MKPARLLALFVVSAVLVACSFFEPETGPRQEGVAAAVATTDPGGYGPRPDASSDGGDPRCSADAGYADNACDTCENVNCCTTRFGCYDDATCNAANKAFDPCLSAAKDIYGSPDPVAVRRCWDTLAASGPAAKARVDCQRAKCKTVCAVP